MYILILIALLTIVSVTSAMLLYKKEGTKIIYGTLVIMVIYLLVSFLLNDTLGLAVLTMLILPSIICGISIEGDDTFGFTILITGTSLFIGMLILFTYSKYINNYDMIQILYEQIASLKEVFLELWENNKYELLNSGSNIDDEAINDLYGQMHTIIEQTTSLMSYLLFAIIYVNSLIISFFQVLFTRIILNKLGKKQFELNEILNVDVKKSLIFFYITISIFKLLVNHEGYYGIATAVDNTSFVMQSILSIMGFAILMYIVKNIKINIVGKIIIIVISLFWLLVSPFIFIVICILEGIIGFKNRIQKKES